VANFQIGPRLSLVSEYREIPVREEGKKNEDSRDPEGKRLSWIRKIQLRGGFELPKCKRTPSGKVKEKAMVHKKEWTGKVGTNHAGGKTGCQAGDGGGDRVAGMTKALLIPAGPGGV